jgi:hypothetical protein
MDKRIVAAALIVTCLAGGARAASLDVPPYDLPPAPYAVPQPNIIPLPGMIEPQFEVGVRYWWSEGKVEASTNATNLKPSFGVPDSTLNYDHATANTGELAFRARSESNLFAKGFFGGGPLSGGTLDVGGSFPAGGTFSYKDNSLDGTDLVYGTLDVGSEVGSASPIMASSSPASRSERSWASPLWAWPRSRQGRSSAGTGRAPIKTRAIGTIAIRPMGIAALI